MRRTLMCFCVLGAAVPSLAAQENLYSTNGGGSGVQYREYSYEAGSPNQSVSQLAVPMVWLFSIGRSLAIDVGTTYAWSRITKANGNDESLDGLTDTQVRASYVFGKDILVTTLMLNIPTGVETLTLAEQQVAGAISSNFLLFPVNSYGTGFSATGGVAAAFPIGGSWNLGAAGSVRVNAEYEPFANNPSVTYQPGVQGSARVGADGLIGSSRLAVGFTFSTFTNDQFSSGLGAYSPGNRFIVQMSLTAPLGPGTLTPYLWNYYRANQGGSSGAPSSEENIFTGGVAGSFHLGGRFGLEPVAEARFWSASNSQSGQLYGLGAALRVQLGPHFAIWPGGRFDFGSIDTPVFSTKSVTGWEIDGLVRFTY
jgi:hypothetical protein